VNPPNMRLIRCLSFVLAITLVVISLLAVAQPALAAPTITASPNPVLIPEGKTEGTATLVWDAGADWSDSRVWFTIDGGKEDIFAASSKGTSEIKVLMDRIYTFKLYSRDGTKVLASIVVKGRRPEPPKPALSEIPRSAPGAHPAYLYGVLPDGTFRWYRHDGRGRGTVEWQGPRDITTGLTGLKQAFAGGETRLFFTIALNGNLKEFRHSFADSAGAFDTKGDEVPQNIGNGWQNFRNVFSAGEHTINAVTQDGTLKWYRYDSSVFPLDERWEGPKDIAYGWGNFKTVFSTGDGIIYVITPDGKLLWHKHNFYKYGVGSEGQGGQGEPAWEGPKQVGTGWQNFRQVFSPGEGIIYAVTKEGKLLWYRHQGYRNGSPIWLGPKEIAGSGWENFDHAFALLDRGSLDYDRSIPSGMKVIPPVFSSRPESFFKDLIVQPRSNLAIISYTPSANCRVLIEVSTQKPNPLPESIPLDKRWTVKNFPPEAKASSYCSEFLFGGSSMDRRDCRIERLAPNTTYYFVIYAETKTPPDAGDPRQIDNDGPVYFYSGSFKTRETETIRPRKF
jgi:tachylectin